MGISEQASFFLGGFGIGRVKSWLEQLVMKTRQSQFQGFTMSNDQRTPGWLGFVGDLWMIFRGEFLGDFWAIQ